MDTPETLDSHETRISAPIPTILQYIREKGKYDKFTKTRSRGDLRGVLVSDVDKETNTINIGWSFVSKKPSKDGKSDKFNKDIGIRIAVGRMNLTKPPKKCKLPHNVRKQIPHILSQTARYFKLDVFRVKVNGAIVPDPYKLVID